jgi:hypothetical protein
MLILCYITEDPVSKDLIFWKLINLLKNVSKCISKSWNFKWNCLVDGQLKVSILKFYEFTTFPKKFQFFLEKVLKLDLIPVREKLKSLNLKQKCLVGQFKYLHS